MDKWIAYREMKRNKTSIATQLRNEHKKTILENREYLKVIIECLVFTAQQNIAQRGHHEERKNIEVISDENRGNFFELLHMRCKDISWLADISKFQLDHRRQWTTWLIQNELSVIMDKTTDIGKIEQVALCLSFIISGEKRESFVGFFDTKRTNAPALLELLKRATDSLNLDISKIVGECFDGASNMSGEHAALMKKAASLSLYVHCYAHRLNLAIEDSISSIGSLRNGLGTIQSLYVFIGASAKRTANFNETEIESEAVNLTLKSQSETRWACRYEAVKAVDEQLERIVKTLIKLRNDKESKAKPRSEARRLLIAICNFDFALNMKILRFIFSNTNALSRYFQGKDVDVLNARRNADMTISTLKSCRDDEQYDLMWNAAFLLAKDIKIWLGDDEVEFKEAALPRPQNPSTRHQSLVGEVIGTESETTDFITHYRIQYVSCRDAVIGELVYRFQGKDNIICALGRVCLDAEVIWKR